MGEGMFAALLRPGGHAQKRLFGDAAGGDHFGDGGAAFGDGAGLVEHHGVQRVGALQRLLIADEDACAGGGACAHHEGGGRRQTQRAGAGDDHHGDGGQQPARWIAHDQPPAQKCQGRDGDDHRHEDGRDLVYELLHRRLVGLRVLHQSDDAREGRLLAHRRRLHPQQTLAIDGAAGDMGARGFFHGQALAGQQALVHGAGAREHAAIHGQALAGAHHHHIAKGDS